MDLKSFYKKIDVDNIKNRLPPLPQIKIPKIKSRKIFKSSREDLSQQQPPVGAMGGPPLTPQSLPPPSAFIDRTPTRISTVSSLMNINYGLEDKNQSGLSTYRTANNFEAENCPDKLDNGDTQSAGNAATRFSDKCRKTYRELSDFKLKNIFQKKTIVKKTEIEVDMYARQYERELREEQELEEQMEDKGYEFEFKEARRCLSRSSNSISPPDSVTSGVPSPIRSELGHLQRNETPPMLARRRNAIDEPGPLRRRLQRSMSEESGGEPPKKPIRSSLWGITEKDIAEDPTEPQTTSFRAGISKLGAFRKSKKERASSEAPEQTGSMWNLKSIRTRFASEESGSERKPNKSLQSEDSVDEHSDHEKKGWKLSNIHLRYVEPSEKTNEPQMSSPEGKFSSIKQSIKRLNQRKPRRETSEESEADQNEEQPKPNVSGQLRAGLRRLKLKDRSITFDEDDAKTTQVGSKLHNWKKSFKVRQRQSGSDEEGAAAKPPAGRSSTLLRKLNHIRSRKAVSEDCDQAADATQSDDQQKSKSTNLEKLEHARDKAMKKVNAQVQKMKMFHGKSRDSPNESSPEKPRRPRKSDSDEQPSGVIAELPRSAPAIWTTNRIMSQSLDSEDELEVPRVLIHQDNSDQYESTLIIAVTRPAPPAPPSTIIKEIIPKSKAKAIPRSDWIPNKSAISSFLEMTPSPPPTKHLDVGRGHFRKRSMDSNDSDSWIPDNFRNKSCTSSTSGGLNKINENAEPWKVHSVFSEEKLYKTKSIDIFANRDSSAFADFDDEMKNVPIRRIAATSAESFEKSFGESTDDDDDFDNASRITRVKRPSPLISTTVAIETILKRSTDSSKSNQGSPFTSRKGQIGNSQESLDANYDENEELSTDDDDVPPDMAPSPPPSFSPPPPPLPLRKPPRFVPERNDSMVRLAKPLVKQASLRRHFSEDIEPSDLGKVNKLISRFEKNPSLDTAQHVQIIANDNEDDFEVEEKKPPAKPKEEPTRNGSKKRPAPVPKQPDIPKIQPDDAKNNNITTSINNNNEVEEKTEAKGSPPQERAASPPEIQFLDNASLQSPSSVYGSPIGSMCHSERISTSSEYGSPIGMAFPSKAMDQLHTARRLSTRSSLRDDDTFYSFESDEENNFYSFGETSSSNRQVIEI